MFVLMAMIGCYFCKEELQWSEQPTMVSMFSEKTGQLFSPIHDNCWDPTLSILHFVYFVMSY